MAGQDLPLADVNWNFIFLNSLVTLSSGVLWTIDYLDTLPMEIRTFWSRKTKVSFATVVFFVGRYSTLYWVLLSIAYIAPGAPPDILCSITTYASSLAIVLGVLCANTLLLMRAYALCRFSRWILIPGMVIIVARFLYTLYVNMATEAPASSQNEVSLLPRCLIIYHLGNREVERLMQRLLSPILAIVFDTLVLAAVIKSTSRHILEMRGLSQGGLIERVVKDGVLYYVVVLMLAICMTVSDTAQVIGIGSGALGSLGQVVGPFYDVVPNMLASRIMLNARTYNDTSPSTLSLQGDHEVRFARVIGSIGADLRSSLFDEEPDEEV